MYVVFTEGGFKSEEEAVAALKDGIFPLLRNAPGFVKGIWFGDESKGHGLVVFETEEQAKQGVLQIGDNGPVTVTSSTVYRLQAELPAP